MYQNYSPIDEIKDQITQYQRVCEQSLAIVNNQAQKIQELTELSKSKENPRLDQLMNDYARISQISDLANRAKKVIQESKSKQYDQKMLKNYGNTIAALSQVYMRRQEIEESISKLQEKKKELDESLEDAEGKMQEARKWAKEAESKEESVTNKLGKEERKQKKKMKDEEQKNKEMLSKTEEIEKQNIIKRTDIEFFVEHYNMLISEFEKKIATVQMPPPNSPILAYTQYIDNSIAELSRRFNQYSQLMSMSYNIDQLKFQIEKLYERLIETHSKYQGRYQDLIQIVESCRYNKSLKENSEKQNQDIITQLEGYKTKFQNYSIEEKNLNEEEQKLTSVRRERESEINRIKANVENKRKFELYKEYINLYNENNSNEQKLSDDIKNIVQFQKAQTEATRISDNYNKNSNNPAVIKATTSEFSSLIEQNKVFIQNMISKFNEIFKNEDDKQTKDSLEKAIKAHTAPPKYTNETRNENYENPELKNCTEEKTQYNTDKDNPNKVVVAWATETVFTKLIFHPLNKEPIFKELNVFACHNALFKPIDILNIIAQVFELVNTGKIVFEDGTKVDIKSFANNVIGYFEKWLEMFPKDFKDNENQNSLKGILENIGKHININAITNNLNEIDKKKDPSPVKTLKKSPNKVKIEPQEGKDKMIHQIYPPSVVAMHLMYIDYEIFRKISYSEYLQCYWSSKIEPEKKSPNLVALTSRFNKLSQFVQYSIVCQKGVKQAAASLEQWIKIMQECFKLHYFHALFAIDGALSSPAVLRLEKTWKQIGPLADEYNKLSRICSPLKKFKDYKAQLANCKKEKTFPYVGPWLTDMTFIKDGNPKSKKEGENILYNIVMHRAYFTAAEFLEGPWGIENVFNIDLKVQELFEKLEVKDNNLDETMLLKLSNKIEKN